MRYLATIRNLGDDAPAWELRTDAASRAEAAGAVLAEAGFTGAALIRRHAGAAGSSYWITEGGRELAVCTVEDLPA